MQITKVTEKDKKEAMAIATTLKDWFNAEGLKNMSIDFELNNTIVAKEGGKVLGFLCYSSYCGKMLLIWMGVVREAQRKGVGSKLLSWLENEAKILGFHSVEVETLPDEDDYKPYQQTRAFYYKNGFKRIFYKKAQIEGWDDQIVLEKKLRPKLKFELNIELDKWTCNSIGFHSSVIRVHPALSESEGLEPEAKKSFNNKYVDDYYKSHRKELEDAVESMKNDWLTIEERFFEAVDKLFNHPWPEGKYICYLSIFNCNPRFIETKDFQAFYKHPETTNHVCAHEMLHFIFYDYMGEKADWKLSEIFNDVVLRLPEFVAITGQKDPGIYAETKQELNNAIKLWGETKSVKAFVAKYFWLISK